MHIPSHRHTALLSGLLKEVEVPAVDRSVLSIPLQMEEWDTTLQFLPATDTKTLEKMSGRRKKLWIGIGLLLLAVAVALMTGLLVWHFNGNSRLLYDQSPLAFDLWKIKGQSLSGIWNITKIGHLAFPENFMKTRQINSRCYMTVKAV